ncbi:hypothetical protein ACOSQ3_026995 [Xanthoceras sorbifolium]
MPYYVALEVVMGKEYNKKEDVWSAGIVLYMMLAGIPPFYCGIAIEIFEAVLRANLRFPTRVFWSVSPSVKDLLRKMRPSFFFFFFCDFFFFFVGWLID